MEKSPYGEERTIMGFADTTKNNLVLLLILSLHSFIQARIFGPTAKCSTLDMPVDRLRC